MSLYKIRVEDVNKNVVSFERYKGRVLLIVNTATKCFFTPQYEELQELYEKYSDRGFEILDFPCNQFANQAPESIEDINKVCIDKYETSFPRFDKVNVNGDEESILYTYLKKYQKGFFGKKIKWNFTKFLIDRKGNVVKRYSPNVKPVKISKDIEKLLRKKA